MAKERWKKFTKDLNKDLMSMAEDPEMLKEAALLLFGTSFEKKMKDHLESLKCLRQYMAPKSGYRSEQFFRGCHHQYLPRGGGSNYRGRGGQRFHPYPHQRSGGETQRPFWRNSKLNRNSLHRDDLCDFTSYIEIQCIHTLYELDNSTTG